MNELDKKLQDILLSEDKIGYIVTQLPNIESQNAFLNYLKTSGTRGNRDLEFLFVLYYLNATSVNEFGSLIRSFLDDLDLKVSSIEEKTNALEGKIDELSFDFELKTKSAIDSGINKSIEYVNSLSNYVIELSEKQSISEEEVLQKAANHATKLIESVFKGVDERIEAKLQTLDAKADEAVLACLAKQLPESSIPAINSTYKRVKKLTESSLWEKNKLIRDVVVNGSTILGVMIIYHVLTKFF
ncbi:hypothetical protein [Aquitalea pelogenes]|uniref:hypothetical protein n=1 Tax=Aquitalea pelogenes TaxID=1293573 RepID=UPI0035B4D67A